MTRVFVLTNHKGGVGKSTSATNIAYGGTDRRTLYITESESGSILRAAMPVAGKAMFSHLA